MLLIKEDFYFSLCRFDYKEKFYVYLWYVCTLYTELNDPLILRFVYTICTHCRYIFFVFAVFYFCSVIYDPCYDCILYNVNLHIILYCYSFSIFKCSTCSIVTMYTLVSVDWFHNPRDTQTFVHFHLPPAF